MNLLILLIKLHKVRLVFGFKSPLYMDLRVFGRLDPCDKPIEYN